jgi:hypothetical protein
VTEAPLRTQSPGSASAAAGWSRCRAPRPRTRTRLSPLDPARPSRAGRCAGALAAGPRSARARAAWQVTVHCHRNADADARGGGRRARCLTGPAVCRGDAVTAAWRPPSSEPSRLCEPCLTRYLGPPSGRRSRREGGAGWASGATRRHPATALGRASEAAAVRQCWTGKRLSRSRAVHEDPVRQRRQETTAGPGPDRTD